MLFTRYSLIVFGLILINLNEICKANDSEYIAIIEELKDKESKLNEDIENFQKIKKSFEDEKEPVRSTDESDVIDLNIGGEILATTRQTLSLFSESLFGILFNGRWENRLHIDDDGNKYFDFNPTIFRHLLDQLQLPNVQNILPPSDPSLTRSFKKMLKQLRLEHLLSSSQNNFIAVNVDGQMITTENKNLTIDPTDSFIDYHPKIFRRLIKLRREKKLTEIDCENESFSSMKSLFLQTFPNNSMMNCLRATRTFWSFDNTLNSFNNKYNGVGINNPTFVSPGYNGAGACLQLNKALKQSVSIDNPPFFNMSYTSLTVEVWIYANTLSDGSIYSENTILDQHQQNDKDLNLHFVIRNRRIYLGFFHDDTSGKTVLKPHEWYHLSYVYDYSTFTQYVYVNGYLDGSRSSAGPYKGTTGNLIFGGRGLNSENSYFDGCLDSISYVNRAKNAAEILRDATLVAFLSFDSSTLIDSGPLKINGIGTNYAFTSAGRVSKALTLSTSNSYVQISGLRRLGTSGWPYSISIWVNPTSATGGTIVHLSKTTSGASGWAIPMIGFTSSGRIAIHSWNGQSVSLTGPIIPVKKWTHIVATYSPTNGQRLYVNNALIGSSTAFTFSAGGAPMIITLGSSIQTGQFYGSLDEFYVYARELTQSEISDLYNNPMS